MITILEDTQLRAKLLFCLTTKKPSIKISGLGFAAVYNKPNAGQEFLRITTLSQHHQLRMKELKKLKGWEFSTK
jgi:hypothetical protein